MKILLTGANGFVGINILYEILSTQNWEIECLVHKNEENIPTYVKKIYQLDENNGKKYNVIIHAGGCPSALECIENPTRAFENNIKTTFYLLEYARKTGIQKFILLSGGEVYGKYDENTNESNLLTSYNMYGASKVSCEHMCSAYFHSYGIASVAIRLIHTFGPYCQKERFPSIIKNKFETEEKPHFILYDESKKRWLDIKEMARRVVFLIVHMENKFDFFNFVGDENLSLVEFIEKISGTKNFTYEYRDNKKPKIPGYQYSGNMNGDKFKSFYSSKINEK